MLTKKIGGWEFALFVVQIFAFWLAWRWMFIRISTSDEEMWSLLALLTAIFFVFAKRESYPLSIFSLFAVAVCTSLFAASIFFAPPLIRGFLAITSLTFLLSRWRFGRDFHFGLWSLLLLSLPISASLNFYAGFPLRVAVGEITAFLLNLNGLSVFREGVCLHFGEKLIWIDAPCAGIKMIWFGLFLTASLVCFYEFRFLKTVSAFIAAFLIILFGNISRASSLFYIESEIIQAPAWAHEAIGFFSFILIGAGISGVIFYLNRLNIRKPKEFDNLEQPKSLVLSKLTKLFSFLLILASLAAFSLSFFAFKKNQVQSLPNFRGFPTEFEGFPLTELPLSERERFFLQDFPGNIGRFSDGRREIVIRYVTQATRQLHPASDCFRAIGYKTEPLPIENENGENNRSCFSATKGDDKLKVCERIFNEKGENWTDVSAWYWSALSETNGEWWAITTAEAR